MFRSHVSSALQSNSPSLKCACECDVGAHVQPSTSTRASSSTDDGFEKANRSLGKRIPKNPPLSLRGGGSLHLARETREEGDRRERREAKSPGGREYILGRAGAKRDRDHGPSNRDLFARNFDVGRMGANSWDCHLHLLQPTTDGQARSGNVPWMEEEEESWIGISAQDYSKANPCASLGTNSNGRGKEKEVQPSSMRMCLSKKSSWNAPADVPHHPADREDCSLKILFPVTRGRG